MTQSGVHGSMEYVKQLEAERDALRARIALLEKVVEWACVRLGIVNDPAYSGYTHDLCNEVIAELRRRAKEGR